MNLKKINIFSEVCFLISSSIVLLIPFLDTNYVKNSYTYVIASIFWIFLLIAIGIQIFVFIRTKKHEVHNNLRLHKLVTGVIAIFSFILTIIAISFFGTNQIMLPLVLFMLLFSVESYSVICRMEKLP